jgi:hypothetical protein
MGTTQTNKHCKSIDFLLNLFLRADGDLQTRMLSGQVIATRRGSLRNKIMNDRR